MRFKRLCQWLMVLGLILRPTAILAQINAIPEDKAIAVILTEAVGEPYRGQVAVAEVLRRRGSLKGFCGLKRKDLDEWIKKQGTKAYRRAQRAWRQSSTTNYSNSATHFENVQSFGTPSWAKTGVIQTAIIGHHTFFRKA